MQASEFCDGFAQQIAETAYIHWVGQVEDEFAVADKQVYQQ